MLHQPECGTIQSRSTNSGPSKNDSQINDIKNKDQETSHNMQTEVPRNGVDGTSSLGLEMHPRAMSDAAGEGVSWTSLPHAGAEVER